MNLKFILFIKAVSFALVYVISCSGISAKTILQDITLPGDSINLNVNIIYTVDLFNLKIEDPASGVQFYKNGIIYLLDTKEAEKNLKAAFGSLDTYYAPLKPGKLGKRDIFSKQFAFLYPTESVTFTEDYSRMYFTNGTKFKGSANDVVKIYKSEYLNSGKKSKRGWSETFSPIPFNSENFSCVQPTISVNGKIMVFSSDKPGGYGKFDLYIVLMKENKWDTPINLGKNINSSENESFPFLLDPGTLFFASDGHPGYGDYDIYMTRFNGTNWSEVLNLGEPVNSEGNEVAFTISRSDHRMAFFSSNRNLYKKQFQLFQAFLRFGTEYLASKDPFNYISFIAMDISEEAEKQTQMPVLKNTTTGPKKPEKVIDKKDKPEKSIKKEPVIVLMDKPEETAKPAEEVTKRTEPIKVEDIPAKTNLQAPIKPVENVDFRVQFKSSVKPLGEFKISINGIEYTTSEYFYKGAYRYTVGHFATANPARELQNKCRKSGYKEAFVAAFKNNKRTLDKEIFIKYR